MKNTFTDILYIGLDILLFCTALTLILSLFNTQKKLVNTYSAAQQNHQVVQIILDD